MPSNEYDFETQEYLEKKLKIINEHAAEQYRKAGKLSSSVLIEENNELDGQLNKELLEKRIAQYAAKKE